MNYKPNSRPDLAIITGLIKGIAWLIITPIKWIFKKIQGK